jgi:5-methylthioadenosine/S-adenosylhomocysteine deaminase
VYVERINISFFQINKWGNMSDMAGDFMGADVDILIKNALIVTMDAERRVIRHGALAVKADKIVALGPEQDILPHYRAPIMLDGTKKIVMPGLINVHTHSPMTIFRGYADDMPLKKWLYDYIFPAESAFINADTVHLGTRLAVAEMLKSGTTTFNDMYYHIEEMVDVVEKTGIRAVLTHSLIDFPVPGCPDVDYGLRFTEEMIQTWNAHPRITIGVAVHANYSSAAEIYQRAHALAVEYHVPFNTHLAETKWEFDLVMKKYGVTPVKYLDDLGVLSKQMIAAHCVHLTAEDIDILAKRGVGVAHNPQCNMKLASGIAPIPELLAHGVRVGIGTDGVASNNDLDLFDEMRTAAFLHKLANNDPSILDAASVLELATIGGARLLGMEDQIGSLEPGKQADIIMLDLDQPHAHPIYNIYSLIVYSLRGSDVETAIVAGKVLMHKRALINVNQQALFDQVDAVAREIREKSKVEAQ